MDEADVEEVEPAEVDVAAVGLEPDPETASLTGDERLELLMVIPDEAAPVVDG